MAEIAHRRRGNIVKFSVHGNSIAMIILQTNFASHQPRGLKFDLRPYGLWSNKVVGAGKDGTDQNGHSKQPLLQPGAIRKQNIKRVCTCKSPFSLTTVSLSYVNRKRAFVAPGGILDDIYLFRWIEKIQRNELVHHDG